MRQLNPMPSVFVVMLLLHCCCTYAQKRWVGGNGSWDNVLNWRPAALPDSTDQVILDNSLQTDTYTVSLPPHAVTVNSIIITPGAGKQIELHLPSSNISSPAFTTIATGDAVIIRSGGTFRNSAGTGGGQSLNIRGLMCIESNGVYVHNTRSTHADIVAKLSQIPGTENGVFEFDVPGGSYPVSLSNRVYGKLVFSSLASGGTQTYNASGTNPLLVRGDLVINAGVILNIDFTKDITIMGNYRQEGGVFNVASQPNSNVVNIWGDVRQSAAGVITETSTGGPVIEFNGTVQQQVSIAGSITNQVSLRINTAGNMLLLHDLTIPFTLQFQKGNIITSSAALLIIPDNSRITGASANSFVNGPVKKTGGGAFEFPLGKQHDYAPAAISAGTANTDEFVAEYFLGNPQSIYGVSLDNSIIRVSALEYWRIEKTAGTSSGKITLSVGNYSHATALDKLVVSYWDTGSSSWKNKGNSSYSGVSTGKITSDDVTGYGAFTLASTVPEQNPLPLVPVNFHALYDGNKPVFYWQTADDFTGRFEIEQSGYQKSFIAVATLFSHPGNTHYQFIFPALQAGRFFRLKMITETGVIYYSDVVPVAADKPSFQIRQVKASGNNVLLSVVSDQKQQLRVVISGIDGKTLYDAREEAFAGSNMIRCLLPVPHGMYIVQVSDQQGRREVRRVVKE